MTGAAADAGPLAVGALLLAVGGAAKLARPHDTARALRAARWPVGPSTVRLGATIELLVGAAALTVGGPITASMVALSYVALTAFVAGALVNGLPLATCACFGEADTPPTVLHALVNLLLAVAAGLAVATGATRPLVALTPEVVAGTGVATYVTFLLLTALPRLGWR